MQRGLIVALDLVLTFLLAGLLAGAGVQPASAQQTAPQCAQFPNLSAETKKRADAVSAAMKAKVERKQVCVLMTAFVAAEGKLVKFLEDNKTWCGVPDQVIKVSKANHEKSIKFRTGACTEAPQAKPPSLSDAIKTPALDSAANTSTKANRGGTFDTLTGNPLAR